MMDKEVFNIKHIMFDSISQTQEEAFDNIARFVCQLGYVKDEEAYARGLRLRESESTTGFKDNIAIPHCKDKTNILPGIFLVKFKNAIPWNSLDGKPVKVAFALTIPVKGAQNHLKLLSLIARKLIDDEFRNSVLEINDPELLSKVIDEINY